jgi:integrase
MEQLTINQLKEGVLGKLRELNYASLSLKMYQQRCSRFEKYAAENGELFLSDELFERYMLDTFGWHENSCEKPTANITAQLRTIRLLKVYGESGNIPGKIASPKEPPDRFRCHYDQYMSECVGRGLSSKTIKNRSLDICDMLIYAESRKLKSIDELSVELLDEYLAIRSGETPGGMNKVLSSLRCFLRSLFSNSVIPNDLSYLLPSGSKYPTKPVQRLWTQKEVIDLLASVDRSDSKGKRDYAIMLLAIKYGIRAWDILNLKLSDIRWDSMEIQFRQSKTSVINVLPILDDVGWALADWITNARPKQATINLVFTRLTAPYCGITEIDNIFKRRMITAGIRITGCGKSGAHSLRHGLASNMLAGQVPLPVIASVLGHSSSASTTVYLHSDIEGLRQCAIECPGEEGRS